MNYVPDPILSAEHTIRYLTLTPAPEGGGVLIPTLQKGKLRSRKINKLDERTGTGPRQLTSREHVHHYILQQVRVMP